jgi:hypothetical protein
MKTRTNIQAGASPLQACKQQKEYWMGQAQYMENILSHCQQYTPPAPPSPYPAPPYPGPSGGGYVNGVWYSDQSGTCA